MTIFRLLLAILFITAGTMHFVRTNFFLSIMPPYLPYHLEIVYISGVFEILGGVGLLVPQVRKWAAYGLILLLVAVFPANIQMLINYIKANESITSIIVLILRLPIQFLLIYWVYQCTKETLVVKMEK